MEKKKILYVITKGSPFGGAQRYVYDLATNTPDGFEAIIVCGFGDELPNALIEKGVRVIKIENLEREVDARKDWAVFRELMKIIREEKPNIVHLNSSKIGLLGTLAVLYLNVLNLFRISNFACRPARQGFRIYAVFTAHGWAFNERNRSSFNRMIYYIGHYLTVLFSDNTITVSNKAKRDIDWLLFIKDKIKVIHNGIGKFKLRIRREARIILAGKETKKVIIISASELHHNKGLDIALRGIARLPERIREKIIYCIAGGGEEKDNLTKLAKDLAIEKNVRFLGFTPNVKELFSGADLFLLPSRTEAFPYALLEAGATPLPIIAASVGGVPEIVRNMQNGILIHPRSSREVAEAINYILQNAAKRKMFKERIKETVADVFSISKMLDETYSLYDSLVNV